MWAGNSAQALKALEAEGALLQRAQEAREEALQAPQRAVEMEGENPPLTAHELYQMYGGTSLSL